MHSAGRSMWSPGRNHCSTDNNKCKRNTEKERNIKHIIWSLWTEGRIERSRSLRHYSTRTHLLSLKADMVLSCIYICAYRGRRDTRLSKALPLCLCLQYDQL